MLNGDVCTYYSCIWMDWAQVCVCMCECLNIKPTSRQCSKLISKSNKRNICNSLLHIFTISIHTTPFKSHLICNSEYSLSMSYIPHRCKINRNSPIWKTNCEHASLCFCFKQNEIVRRVANVFFGILTSHWKLAYWDCHCGPTS